MKKEISLVKIATQVVDFDPHPEDGLGFMYLKLTDRAFGSKIKATATLANKKALDTICEEMCGKDLCDAIYFGKKADIPVFQFVYEKAGSSLTPIAVYRPSKDKYYNFEEDMYSTFLSHCTCKLTSIGNVKADGTIPLNLRDNADLDLRIFVSMDELDEIAKVLYPYSNDPTTELLKDLNFDHKKEFECFLQANHSFTGDFIQYPEAILFGDQQAMITSKANHEDSEEDDQK